MSVFETAESYVEAKELSGRGVGAGRVGADVGGQLDAAAEAGTARAMSAVPPIASRLMEVLDRLEEFSPDERDEIEAMLRPLRRAA